MPFVQVKAVENDGTVLLALDRADPKVCSWVLNKPGRGVFAIHPLDAQAEELRTHTLAGCEIQFWRDDECIWWGVPRSASLNKSELVYECAGLRDYFNELHFGPIETNYVDNGGFEDDLTDWDDPDTIASVSTTVRYEGAKAALLEASAPGADEYIEQTQNFTSGVDGLAIFVSARFFWDSSAGTTPPFEERGLVLYWDTGAIKGTDIRWDPITANTSKDQWVKLGTHINIGASLTNEPVTVRLMATEGCYWDDVVWTVEESVSTALDGQTDVSTFIASLLAYLEAKAPHLNLALTNPSTGVKLIRAVQFYECLLAKDVFEDFSRMGACDISIEIDTAGTTRTLTVHPGTKGSLKSSFPLAVDVDDEEGSSLSFDWTSDFVESRNYGIGMGEGQGATRDFAVASDLTALGGVRREFTVTAPPGTSKAALQALVETEVARRKRLVEIPANRVKAEGWLGQVVEGDTVPVVFNYGWAQLSANHRIIAQELDFKSDTILPVLNP